MVVIDWVACGGWRCCTSLLYSGSWRSRGPWPGDLATGLARRVEALTPCQPDVTSSGPDYWRNWVAYPTQDDVMQADPLLEWIDTEFLRPDPFAFACKGFKSIVSLITREFKVDPNGVYCIGSGAIGLSMNPVKIMEKGLKPFGADSDVNIHVLAAGVLESRRVGEVGGWVVRDGGWYQVGAGIGGRQGSPVRALRMPARTSTPCLRMVSM